MKSACLRSSLFSLVVTLCAHAIATAAIEPWVHAPSQREPAAPAGMGTCDKPSAFTLPDAIYPIFPHSGEFYTSAVDLRIKGVGMDFVWARVYGSNTGPDSAQGRGWDWSYNISIATSGAGLLLKNGCGRQTQYSLQPDGSFTAAGYLRQITGNSTAYTLTFPDGGTWNFRPIDGSARSGKIDTIIDRNGNMMSFNYNVSNGQLNQIRDTLNRNITISYTSNLPDAKIALVRDFTGREIQYTYSNEGYLLTARSPIVEGTPNGNDFPDGKLTTYAYSNGFANAELNGNLLSIRDPRGNIVITNTYHATTNPADPNFDHITRCVRGDQGPTGDIIDIVYVPLAAGAVKAILNDEVGNVKEFTYDAFAQMTRFDEFTGRANPDQPTTESTNRPVEKLRATDPDFFRTECEYGNSDFLMTRRTFPDLNEERFVYDTANVNRRSQGNMLQHHRLAGPLGGDQAEHIDFYEYQPGQGSCCGVNFVTRHVNPRGIQTLNTFDSSGNRLSTTYPVAGMSESWTYNGSGQVIKHILPDNGTGSGCRRVDTYGYSGGYLFLEVVDTTDPAACSGPHLNLSTNYQRDLLGNIQVRTDPRGQSETYAYSQLDQVVKHLSQPGPGNTRIETLYYFDANDNLARVDVENLNEAGVRPTTNTHVSTITDFGLRNEQLRVASEFGSALLSNTVLTTAQIPAGDQAKFAITEYAYDPNRNRTLERFGEAVRGTQPFNTRNTLFDERGMVYRQIRAQGAPGAGGQSTTQFDYNGAGKLVRVTEGLESSPHVSTSIFDGFGRLMLATDAMGNITQYHYDASGNPGGNATESPPVPHPFAMRLSGELLDIPGSAGNIRLSEIMSSYDALGRKVREDVRHFDSQTQAAIGDGQSTTIWTYTNTSQLRTVQDDSASIITTAYDTANRVASVTDLRGNSTTNGYDLNGNIISTARRDISDLGSPNQVFTTTSVFDNLNRTISVTEGAGNTRLFGYDSRNNIVLRTDARGILTRLTFDGMNRLLSTSIDMNANGVYTDAADIITTQNWDFSSRLIGQVDDNGNVTAYQPDALDRVTRNTSADGTFDQFSYDVHNNLIQTIDANGTIVANSFDSNERLVNRTVTLAPGVLGTTSESYQYDGRSRVIRAQNNNSVVTRGSANSSGYDSISRILRESQQVLPGGPVRTVTASYNGIGNQTSLNYPGGRRVLRSFDNINRLFAIVDGVTATEIGHYNYYGPSRIQRFDRVNGTSTEFTYDGIDGQANPPNDFGFGRIVRTRSTVIASGSVIEERTYTWDRESNKTQRNDVREGPSPLRHNFTNDAAGRLTRTIAIDNVTNTVVRDEQYTLDGVGNRTSVIGGLTPGIYTMDAALPEPADRQVNQYTQTSFDTRTYDKSGDLVSFGVAQPCPADFNQDLVIDFFDYLDFVNAFSILDPASDFNEDGVIDFFDYLDFVQVFGIPCNPQSGNTASYDYRHRMVEHRADTVTRFAYDALGRRIEKTTDATGTPARTRYYYDGWQEAEEQDGTSGATLATYVYGPYIDDAVQIVRGGQTYYPHQDDNYNVMAMTNASGVVVERYDYGDFGQPKFFTAAGGSLSASAIGNPLLFNGRRFDQDTGWFYYRTRYLDPIAGRFTSHDSIGTWGDPSNQGNGQAYVANSPWSALDPSGTTIYCPSPTSSCFKCGYCPVVGPCGERTWPCQIGAFAARPVFDSGVSQAAGFGGAARGPGTNIVLIWPGRASSLVTPLHPGGSDATRPGNPQPARLPPVSIYESKGTRSASFAAAPGGFACNLNPWLPGCPCGGVNPPASCFGMGTSGIGSDVSLFKSRAHRECDNGGNYWRDGVCYMKPPPGWGNTQ